MITKEQEQRLRNWARANRECPRAKKGATLVFCESLRYWFDHEAERERNSRQDNHNPKSRRSTLPMPTFWTPLTVTNKCSQSIVRSFECSTVNGDTPGTLNAPSLLEKKHSKNIRNGLCFSCTKLSNN